MKPKSKRDFFSSLAFCGMLILAAGPGVGVTCSRDIVPGAELEIYGPYGTSIRSGGGKTVIGADIPGVRFKASQ